MHINLIEISRSLKIPNPVRAIKLSSAIIKKKNFELIAKIGAHRTLTYLTPLLSFLSKTRINSTESYANQTTLNEIYSQTKLEKSPIHGALIVVPYNEMLYSTYTIIRTISPILNVFRTNNIANIVGMTKYLTEKNADEIKKKYSESFRQRSINWNVFDVGVTTPAYLENLAVVNPEFVVFDEIPE